MQELGQLESPTASLDQRLAKSARSLRTTRLQDALDSLGDGLALTNEEGLVTMVNEAFAAILGQPSKEAFLGQPMHAGLRCPDEERNGPLFDPALADRPVVAELVRDMAGGRRILRAARYPWRGEHEPRGHVWSLRDTTQAKLAEKMLNEFTDSATHELRTPLTNLKAYAETLSLSDVLEVHQQKEFCNIISSEATRLASLIDDLLDISSMQVGAMSIARQKVDRTRLLQEVVLKVRPQMDQKDLGLEVRLSEKLPEMQLDKDKFSAALVNLLGNAAKYTPPGGNVTFRVEVADNNLVAEIEDTGFGIAEDELPRLFEKFFRSANEQVQAETGSGLGLSLVQEVVRLHGGDIAVTSELGVGSKFTVKIPVR